MIIEFTIFKTVISIMAFFIIVLLIGYILQLDKKFDKRDFKDKYIDYNIRHLQKKEE